jgi:NAD(P)-dependent dehydrogenase (short-subunit alcohol dehydrogenase family)
VVLDLQHDVEQRHALERASHGQRAGVERYLKDSYADPEEGMASIRKRQLSDELGRPEDVAHAALYLASDESRFVMASGLVIDGGVTGAKS